MMHRQVAGNMVSYGPFPVVGMEGALDRSPQKERQVVPAKSSGRIRFSKEKKTLLAILRVCDFFWDGDFFVTISIKIFGDLQLRHQVGSLWITSLKSCDLWLRKVFSSILFGVFDNFWLLTNNLFTFRAIPTPINNHVWQIGARECVVPLFYKSSEGQDHSHPLQMHWSCWWSTERMSHAIC